MCCAAAPCSRCLSAPPRAPTIFSASRSFAILSLAVAIISLTAVSFVPYAQVIFENLTATAAATRSTFTVPGLSPFEPDTPAPITPFILALLPTASDRFSTHPAALLLSGHTSRSPPGWSCLELAAALVARQSHGWRGGEGSRPARWPIPRLNGVCSGLLGRVVA